jgi:FOG: TPR repeat, SEL1 subfamily
MKKGLIVILSLLFSTIVYANQCSKYWYKENYEKALTLCKVEAEQGNTESQYFLAYMYDVGNGTEPDKQKAFYWYKKAAEQGNVDAQNNLAVMYNEGDVTEKNIQKAFYWYK